MAVTSLTRSQTRSGEAAMWTVTESCMSGMKPRVLSVDGEGPEHHAGPRFGAEVGRLGRHAPAFVRPHVDLFDGDRPQDEGGLGLTARQRLHGLVHRVTMHDLVQGEGG